MRLSKEKTGQHVDDLKHHVLHPWLVNEICAQPDLPQSLALLDIGSGDASSLQDVRELLKQQGRNIHRVSLLEADPTQFGELLRRLLSFARHGEVGSLIQSGAWPEMQAFLDQNRETYDAVVCQLVLHHVPNDSEGSYLMYVAYHALKTRWAPLGNQS